MKKIVLLLSTFLLFTAAIGLISWKIWSKNTIIIENKSTKTISKASITVCQQTYYFKNIPPGKSDSINFTVNRDSSFLVHVSFDDDQMLQKEVGYIPGGAAKYHNRIQITTDLWKWAVIWVNSGDFLFPVFAL